MIGLIKINRNFILFSIGTALIFLSFALIFYDRYEYIKNGIFAEIELAKYNETKIENSDKEEDNDELTSDEQGVDVNTEYVVDSGENESGTSDNNSSSGIDMDYIGFLSIEKIDLKVGLVSKNSKYNDVDRNVEILAPSDYPDVVNGNFILASHSGTSKISYFKHLYKLELNDTAVVYYEDYVYHYKSVDIYYVPKTGSLKIKRNSEKTVMTLITCTKDSKTLQTVYILELFSKTRNGEVDG